MTLAKSYLDTLHQAVLYSLLLFTVGSAFVRLTLIEAILKTDVRAEVNQITAGRIVRSFEEHPGKAAIVGLLLLQTTTPHSRLLTGSSLVDEPKMSSTTTMVEPKAVPKRPGLGERRLAVGPVLGCHLSKPSQGKPEPASQTFDDRTQRVSESDADTIVDLRNRSSRETVREQKITRANTAPPFEPVKPMGGPFGKAIRTPARRRSLDATKREGGKRVRTLTAPVDIRFWMTATAADPDARPKLHRQSTVHPAAFGRVDADNREYMFVSEPEMIGSS